MEKSVTYDPKLIEDTQLEETDTTGYYSQCCVFLDEFLDARPDLADQGIRKRVQQLLAWMCADLEDRNPNTAADIAVDLLLFGMVGKAMYFLRNQEHAPQFHKEVRRFFSDINHVRSNAWLFHTAGMLARAGFEVAFIGELGDEERRTPDYKAHRAGLTVFVEATARSQAHHQIDDIATLLWDVMHGDKSNGKQLKFVDPQYDPGLIAVDVSNCNLNANAANLPPYVKLKREAIVVQNDRGYVYDLAKDPEFFRRMENTGNVVEYAIRYFHAMAAKGRYHVRALLVGVALRFIRDGNTVSAPKAAAIFVDRRYPQLAIQALSPSIYLIDTQAPLPEQDES